MVKTLFAIAILVVVGCSNPTSNPDPPPPGWVNTIQPGTFIGTWWLGTQTDVCTCFVYESDSLFKASIINSATNEDLALNGGVPLMVFSRANRSYAHDFIVTDSSNFYGDTDAAPMSLVDPNCSLSYNTDTLFYSTKRGNDSLLITCNRVLE